jgi:hypothetical protein
VKLKGKLAAALAGGTVLGAYNLYSRSRRPKPLKGSYPEAQEGPHRRWGVRRSGRGGGADASPR